jgi:LacI family transcriptional regulator
MSWKKARIKDIADISGVSIGTVDRVLHNRGEVANETRKRVLDVAKELNYSPNLIAQTLRSKKRINIAVLMPESSGENPFWYKHEQGINNVINELVPYPVILNKIEFDIQNEKDFERKADLVLKLNADGVLFPPIFKVESISLCQKLKIANIPVVFFDGFIDDTGFLAYVGEDAIRSGRVAGQLADMITPAGSDIIVINIAKDLENIHHLNNRAKGFLEYFQTSGKNKGRKLMVNVPDPDMKKISTEIDPLFRSHFKPGTVFVSSSRAHLLARHLENEGLKKINLIGYDLLEENVRYLKAGYIKFLIGQRPAEQTYNGIRKLFEYLLFSRIPEKMEYLPIDIISSENVDCFM